MYNLLSRNKTNQMKTKRISLSVDIDKEEFILGDGKRFTAGQIAKMLSEGRSMEMTVMAERLINQFEYDFEKAREFYKSLG